MFVQIAASLAAASSIALGIPELPHPSMRANFQSVLRSR